MSHFKLLVISAEPEEVAALLQPFHEFECTGVNDQYVQEIDCTEEKRKEYESNKSEGQSFLDYLAEEGFAMVEPGYTPELEGDGKYAYVLLDASGEVEKAIDRTNPNAKWDYWTVGGRYSGGLLGQSQLRRADLNLDAARAAAVAERKARIDAVITASRLPAETVYRVLPLRTGLNAEWQALPEPKPRGQAYFEWASAKGGDYAICAQLEGRVPAFGMPDLGQAASVEEWIAAAPPVLTYAMLKDGKWEARGKMGWFDVSDDKISQEAWDAYVLETVTALPPDALLTVIDCHI
jgi:hypothetical protein